MKYKLLIITILYSVNIVGQTLTYSSFSQTLPITQPVNLANNATFNTAWNTTVGNGVTWNASTIAPALGVPVINMGYYSPSSTPYANLYPMSTHSQYDPALTSVLEYAYWIISADSIAEAGSYAPSAEHEIYTDPDKRLIFPFSYGLSFSDSYAKVNYSDATTISSYQTGTRTVTFSGYGTLILPQGTFNNVALISELRTNNLGPNSTTFTWYELSSGRTLMYYHENDGSVSAFYSAGSPSAINENESGISFSIYPNPGSGIFAISSNKTFIEEVEIYDIIGNKLYDEKVRSNHQKINAGLTKGIYVVKINAGEEEVSRKLIIQ